MPLLLVHAQQEVLRLSRCCSCAPGRPLRPLPLRLRPRAAMATLYIQVWGGWCSVHMDSTVWCMTLPFTDGASAVCLVYWCLLYTSLLRICRGLALRLPLHALHPWADVFHMEPHPNVYVMCTWQPMHPRSAFTATWAPPATKLMYFSSARRHRLHRPPRPPLYYTNTLTVAKCLVACLGVYDRPPSRY